MKNKLIKSVCYTIDQVKKINILRESAILYCKNKFNILD